MLSAVIGSAMEADPVSGEDTFDHLKNQVGNARETIDTISDSLTSLEKLLNMTKNMNIDTKELNSFLKDTDSMINDTSDAVRLTQEAMGSMTDSIGNILDSTCETLDEAAKTIDKVANKDLSSVTATTKQVAAQLDGVKMNLMKFARSLQKLIPLCQSLYLKLTLLQ